MDDWFGEAAGVVFDANGLLRFVEFHAANAVDLAHLCHGQRGGLGRWHSIAVQNVKLCHGSMIAVWGVVLPTRWPELRRIGAWRFLWLKAVSRH